LIEQEQTKPVLSGKEARAMFERLGHVQGRVEVDLSELLHGTFETFLDLISVRLIGNDLLMDISYKLTDTGIVGKKSDGVCIWVEGLLPDEDDVF